jgi:hypothetical protein
MRLPRGQLVRSRVVADPATALSDALDRRLDGYVVLEPQEAVLLDGAGRGVLTFEAGVPALAYHTGTERGGPAALADLAEPGPFSAELYRVPRGDFPGPDAAAELTVSPGTPAERLGGDPDLADRTRAAAPDGRAADPGADPVASFLADEEKIAAIREQAREEAQRRAAEWGLDDALGEGD